MGLHDAMSGNNDGLYTDDLTTLYSDFVSYNDDHSQKPKPNKHQLSGHSDPWMMTQAGLSASSFPLADAPASNADILGRLSPAMEDVANSLLQQELPLPLVDDVSFDVDIALNSLTPHDQVSKNLVSIGFS